ncbi:MAG: branched-chain amino acid ABC transporter permease [Anaerolineales bacterium]
MSAKRLAALAVVVLVIAALAVLPLFVKKDNIINLACLALLYVALASSWNILGGYAGQTNLGHAAFFGLGTLLTRFLWLGGWPLWAALLVGAVVPVILALIIGAPAFRLKGAYFAIGTLALAQVLNVTVANRWPMITSLPARYLVTYRLMPRYYLFLAVAVFTVGVAYFLVKSRLGLGLMAVREEEDAAESLGVSGLRHKLLAFGVSAFLAGLAGGAFAFYHVGYYPQFPFSPAWTFDAVTATYIGGTGTIVGPIIGAVFYVLVKELLALKLVEAHLIIFGILFILVVLFLPGGLLEVWSKIRSALGGRAKSRKAALPAG